eukprot:EG_transcript_30562
MGCGCSTAEVRALQGPRWTTRNGDVSGETPTPRPSSEQSTPTREREAAYRAMSYAASSDTSCGSEDEDDTLPSPFMEVIRTPVLPVSPSHESKKPLRRDTALTFRLPRQPPTHSEVVAVMSTRAVLWPDACARPPILLVEGCLPPDGWAVRSYTLLSRPPASSRLSQQPPRVADSAAR